MFGNKSKSKNYRTGGTRGGQAHFSWEDVKSDKDRQNYLGHSVHALVGRWQKGKDVFWYNKINEEDRTALDEEKQRMKELDEDLFNEAMGIKPKKRKIVTNELEASEIKQLLDRNKSSQAVAVGDFQVEYEAPKGLGAGQTRRHDHIELLSSVQKDILKVKQGIDIDTENPDETTFQLPGNVLTDSSVDHNDQTIAEGEQKQLPVISGSVIADLKGHESDSSSSSDDGERKKKHKHKHDHKKHKHHSRHKESKDSHRDRKDDDDRKNRKESRRHDRDSRDRKRERDEPDRSRDERRSNRERNDSRRENSRDRRDSRDRYRDRDDRRYEK